MNTRTPHDPALQATLVGMAGLATAMGIGRFAFTPMLPLMQLHDLVSLRQGSLLASANYVGYLLGALLLLAINPLPARAARSGLVAVAVSTLAMAFTSSFPAWLVLRGIAGIASAFVLVGVSGWALAGLGVRRRRHRHCVRRHGGTRDRRDRPDAVGRLDCPWCRSLLCRPGRGAADEGRYTRDGDRRNNPWSGNFYLAVDHLLWRFRFRLHHSRDLPSGGRPLHNQ
jgi:Uncharacterised MFS-type transporter YbfB